MPPFPLTPFLLDIESEIRVTVRDRFRIATALNAGGPWTLARLRSTLAALLGRSPLQQDLIRRRFDQFFRQSLRTEVSPDDAPIDLDAARADLRRWAGMSTAEPIDPDDETDRLDRHAEGRKIARPDRRRIQIGAAILTGVICLALLAGWILFQPKLSVSPTALPFGDCPAGESVTRSVTLTNDGWRAVKVTGIRVTPPDAGGFECPGASRPDRMPAGASVSVPVTFIPETEQPHEATLRITTDPPTSVPPIRLSGTGAPDGPGPLLEGKTVVHTTPGFRVSTEPPVQALRMPIRFWVFLALTLAALILTAAYVVHLVRATRIPPVPPADFDPTGPLLFFRGDIVGPREPILDRETLDAVGDALGHFVSDVPGRDLDVTASVRATSRSGGVSELVFSRHKRPRALMVLEDAHARAAAWNPAAAELVRGMDRLGVEVIHGRFTGAPDRFRTPDGAERWLEDYEDQREGLFVALFTDGGGISRKPCRRALESLGRWPRVAWMDLREPRFWDASVMLPQDAGIPVFPATRRGLRAAFAGLLSEGGTVSEAPLIPASAPPAGKGDDPSARAELILGDALPWAEACARLRPMSLGLADALRRSLYPHLPPERLGRLLALPGTDLDEDRIWLSDPVYAALRRGFDQHRSEADRDKVLREISRHIERAEPEEQDSLAHQSWEMACETIRMTLEPDYDAERLAALAGGPLQDAIEAEFEDYRPPEDRTGIPLSIRTRNPLAWERLKRIRGFGPLTRGQPLAQRLPVGRRRWLRLAGLCAASVVAAVGAITAFPDGPVTVQNLRIEGLGDRQASIERAVGDGWREVRAGDAAALTRSPLKAGQTYRLTVPEAETADGGTQTFMVESRKLVVIRVEDQETRVEWIEPVTGMRFVQIPEGCFQMGSPESEAGRDSNEGPVHEVCIDSFYMGMHEVTVGQWRTFVDATGYQTEAETGGGAYMWDGSEWKMDKDTYWDSPGFDQTESHPVTCISWNDTQGYIKWISGKVKGTFRLPTEAEWEYSCRAGTATARFWGDDPDKACIYANVADQEAKKQFTGWTIHDCNDNAVWTAEAGSYTPNSFGLYDTLGNVWEWCQDIYANDAYSKHDRSNPIYEGDGARRVVRGGSWGSTPGYVRCANRIRFTPASRHHNLGFRLARTE